MNDLLVDAELAELEYRCRERIQEADGHLEPPFASAQLALRLVAEVRRLRSDDWLQRAVEDIEGTMVPHEPGWGGQDEALAILRKHRDGA